MTMKKIAVIAFGMLLFILPTKAQTLESQYGLDSANTILNASLYTEYWKQKNYEEALPSWVRFLERTCISIKYLYPGGRHY